MINILLPSHPLLRSLVANRNDGLFLEAVGSLLLVPILVCVAASLEAMLSASSSSSMWMCAGALLSTTVLDATNTSTGPMPDKRRTHVFRTCLTMAFVFYMSCVVQEELHVFVALVGTLMLLLMVFSNRLMGKNLYVWLHRPELAARPVAAATCTKRIPEKAWVLAVAAVGMLLWWFSFKNALLWPFVLTALCALHRIRVWRTPRNNRPLSEEQHSSIWPRKAKRDADVFVWGSMLVYDHVWSTLIVPGSISWPNTIPPTAIEKTCAQMSMDNLLGYFHHIRPPGPLQSDEYLARAIVERLKQLDERAIVIFDMQSDNPCAAAKTLQDVRDNSVPAHECWELPE